MKRIFVTLLHFVFALPFTLIYGQPINDINPNEWSGTIKWTMRTTYTSPLGSGENEWNIQLVVSEGLAKATVINTFRKGGNPSCSNNIQGSQEGSGTIGDFLFSLMREDGQLRFSVDLAMPVLKGTRTVCGKQESISQGDLALLIEELKISDNPNVISGDSTATTVRRNGREVYNETVQMSVHLSRGPVEVELLVFPEKYDEWLPAPGKTVNEAGSSIEVTFRLVAKGGGDPLKKVKYFEVELVGTSREPGMSINMPANGAAADYDLALVSYGGNETTASSQKQKVMPVEGKNGAVMISAFDGGGYTTLTVTAILEDGERVSGHLLESGGPSSISIPKREAGSKIGEAWLKKYGNLPDEEDADKSPGNQNDGDGLTVYEEYRGVVAEGKFKRLDPRRKELAIQLLSEVDKHEFEKGLQLLSNAAGIEIIRLNKDELGPERRVNKNAATAHRFNQHGMRLMNLPIATGVLGRNAPENIYPKTPRLSDTVIIDVFQAKLQYQTQVDSNKAGGLTTPYTAEENIATTVAHEVAHGIHLDHHGPPSKEINRDATTSSAIPFRVYNTFGGEITERPYPIDGRIGIAGNEESGDLSCIMAYTQEYTWAYRKTDSALIYRAVPPIAVGKRICTSNEGTGINAGGNFFGNATKGNCLSQIKVRDE